MNEPNESTALVQIAPHHEEAVILLLNEVQSVAAKVDTFVVSGPDDVKMATNDLSIIGSLKKKVSDKRKEYTQPLAEYMEGIRAAFKLLEDPLTHADVVLREKVTAYTVEANRKRDEAIAIAREKQAIADREAALNNKPAEVVEIAPLPAAVNGHTTAELGTSSLMAVWKYEVTDFSLLPDEYKLSDTALLTSTAKKYHDDKVIPGVRFYNEPTLKVERLKL